MRPLDARVIHERLGSAGSPWEAIDVRQSTGSTNDDVISTARPYRVVIAGTQTAGRGRRSRSWISPPDTSLAISVTLPLTRAGVAAPDPGWIPLAVGLGVRDALHEVVDNGNAADRFVLKWPNDVLALGAQASTAPHPHHGPAKIGGILCQAHVDKEPLVVAGVGINVTVPLHSLPIPEGTAPPATSLHLLGVPAPSREDIAIAVANHLLRRHKQWLEGDIDRLRRDYETACVTIGSTVNAHLPGNRVERLTAIGIAPGGELRGRRDDGTVVDVRAGDVVHVRPQLDEGGVDG